MKNDDLSTYLNDHLAGSVGAIELVDHLIKKYKDQPIAEFCQEIRHDIAADQEELSDMMKALDIGESRLLQTGVWVAEKFSRVKLRLEGGETGKMGLLLAWEGLVLGIKGKEGLWRALAAVQASWPQLQRYDFARLEKRAVEQGARVEEKRVQTVSAALRPAA